MEATTCIAWSIDIESATPSWLLVFSFTPVCKTAHRHAPVAPGSRELLTLQHHQTLASDRHAVYSPQCSAQLMDPFHGESWLPPTRTCGSVPNYTLHHKKLNVVVL